MIVEILVEKTEKFSVLACRLDLWYDRRYLCFTLAFIVFKIRTKQSVHKYVGVQHCNESLKYYCFSSSQDHTGPFLLDCCSQCLLCLKKSRKIVNQSGILM